MTTERRPASSVAGCAVSYAFLSRFFSQPYLIIPSAEDLLIAIAGPLTHIPMAIFWLVALSLSVGALPTQPTTPLLGSRPLTSLDLAPFHPRKTTARVLLRQLHGEHHRRRRQLQLLERALRGRAHDAGARRLALIARTHFTPCAHSPWLSVSFVGRL